MADLKKRQLNSFFKSSLIVLLIRILGVALSFFTFILITNFFSEVIVGQYNYLNASIVVVGSISLLGLNGSFLQFSGRLQALDSLHSIKNLYFKNIAILITTSFVLICLFLLLSMLFSNYFEEIEIYNVLLYTFYILVFYAVSILNTQVIRGLNKLLLSEIFANIFRYGLFAFIVLFLIYTNKQTLLLDGFFYAFLIFSIATTGVVFYLISLLNTKNKKSVRISYKKIITTSYPMTISFLALLIMQSVDVFILKAYYDFKIIAYYGAVIKISALLGVVLKSINAVIAPKVSELYYAKHKMQLKQLINKSILLNFLFTFPVLLALLFFSEFFLGFFGETYTKASIALKIVVLGQMVNAFSGSVGVYLNMTGKQRVFQKILILALIVNIVLNLFLVPKYEMIGASISTAFSLALWNMLCVIYIYKKDNILFFLTPKLLTQYKTLWQ